MSGRPSTPFPHAHLISHTHSPTTYGSSYFAQPLHFHMEPMSSPVPPSLLNRTSSYSSSSSSSTSTEHRRSSSSSSSSGMYGTPALLGARRPSTASTSSSTNSPEMPSTPISYSTFPVDSPPFLSLGPSITSPPTKTAPIATQTTRPTRPAIKRRDTPRPQTTTLQTLNLTRTESESDSDYFDRIGRKTFTSVIDGGAWIVVEEY